MVQNKNYYCPNCEANRNFVRRDRGVAQSGTYRCDVCKKHFSEWLLHPGGLPGIIADNARNKK